MLFRCDGTADCEDYTDEIGCEVTTLCDPKTVLTYKTLLLNYPMVSFNKVYAHSRNGCVRTDDSVSRNPAVRLPFILNSCHLAVLFGIELIIIFHHFCGPKCVELSFYSSFGFCLDSKAENCPRRKSRCT